MLEVGCILRQGDYIAIDHCQNIENEKAMEIKILDQSTFNEETVIIINKYSAQQIVDTLTKEFNLKGDL